MKENLFLVTLKNPPVTHLIDGYSTQLRKVDCVEFNQEGLRLIIPMNVDCNIAYIKEITPAEAENIARRIKERTGQNKIVKPKFDFPTKRQN